MKKERISILLWIAFMLTWVILTSGALRGLLRGAGLPSEGAAAPGAPPIPLTVVASLLIAGYGIGLWFALQNRKDCPRGAMHLAWSFISASCAMGLLRGMFEVSPLFLSAGLRPLVGFRQVPNALLSFLLLAGLIAMWVGFSRLRLGLHLSWLHIVAIAGILALLPVIYSNVGHLPDSHSVYAVVRFMQSLDPFFLISSAIAGVVLLSIRGEMGRGKMEMSLRFLIAFLLARPVAFVLRVSLPTSVPIATAIVIGLVRGGDWLFVMAVYHRWMVTQKAKELAERYTSN